MANSTAGVRDLVAEVLQTFAAPYPEDITDQVCLAIENNQHWRDTYNYLNSVLPDDVTNNWIGRYTLLLTGLRSFESSRAQSKLIKTYKKLRP